MSERLLFEYVGILQIAISAVVLTTMFARRVFRIFPALVCYLGLSVLCGLITMPLFLFHSQLRIPVLAAYKAYFYTFYVSQILGLCLVALVIYGVFSEAMRPFEGLQRVGRIVFRWVGVVSFVVALALASGPQVFAKSSSAVVAFGNLISQLEQGVNVLILCLLIFVCFSIRPLGLTFRSHLFGVVLGLALTSTVQLVQAAWVATAGAQSMYSPVYIFGMVGTAVSTAVWGAYFALPQPERRMILLPTTSPFFLWNRISEVLGDAPGHVAVAGFTPDMLAPGEIQMLTAATSQEAAAARDREALEMQEADAMPTFSDRVRAPHPSLALSQ